jgi:hypothetical protein
LELALPYYQWPFDYDLPLRTFGTLMTSSSEQYKCYCLK